MLHVLGFSNDLFDFFVNWEEDNQYQYKSVDGVERLFIKSEEVIKKARDHYGC